MAASQADIDAVTAELQDENSTLNTAVAAIQQEITNLQNQGVDVTALQQTVADLGTAVSSAAALVPPVSP
jgi:cell division protein FtsB